MTSKTAHAALVQIPPRALPPLRRSCIQALQTLPLPVWRIYNRSIRTLGRHRTAVTWFSARMDVDISDFIGMFIYHFGVWEPHVSAAIAARLGPGDVFCDVGANIGYHSLLASRAVGDTGQVVAIEASPSIAQQLEHNLRLNAAGNVRVVQAAASDRRGRVTLFRGEQGNSGKTTTVAGHGQEQEADVRCAPLHELLTAEELARLRLIKIDVEGAEGAIINDFLDNRACYADDVDLIVEISGGQEHVARVVGRFRSIGYEPYLLRNDYDVASYLRFQRVEPPLPWTIPHGGQQDILLTRRGR